MMSEFSFDRATSDWDLQAIVKGRSVTTATNTMFNIMPSSYDAWFESLSHENEAFELIKELQPLSYGSSTTNSPQTIVDSSSMIMNYDLYTKSPTDDPKEKTIDANTRAITISKRRKNKHKIIKVVQQAGGDRVSSDKWNWRKYGEKVIKGSPYPRSYYRCSYPAGCLARKQVEQSTNDPGLFLITYMEEHTHPYPTRRHSQAGRSSRRFNNHASTKVLKTNESQNTSDLVRTMSSESSVKDDGVFALRDDEDDGGAQYVGGLCEDDFFAGLDYLEGLDMNFL